jgi:hypothetical protein
VAASGGSGTGAVELTASGACSADSGRFIMTAGSGSCIVVATKAGDADYAAASATVTVGAGPATLYVDATDAGKTLGDRDPVFGWTARGFVSGDSAETVQVSGAAQCSREAGESAGSFAITCEPGSLAAANYRFVAGATGVLTISKADAKDAGAKGAGGSANGKGNGNSTGSGNPSGNAAHAAHEASHGNGIPPAMIAVLVTGGGVVVVGSVGAGVYFIRRRILL